MLIAGFILGIIWGALALSPYNRMKAAIEEGDSEEAWANAKKVRLFMILGIAANAVALLITAISG